MGRFAMTYATTSSFPQTVTQTPAQLGYISAYTIDEGAEALQGYNQLRCKVPGMYIIRADISLSVDSADNFYLEIYRNGLATGFRNGEYIDTSGLGNIGVHGFIDLDVGDIIEIYIVSGSDASYEVTVGGAQFSMVGI